MKHILPIFNREIYSYAASPLAYVFSVTFLVLSGLVTFYLGNFFEAGRADLAPFFSFHPWLYLFFMPALAMRLWAEETKYGSAELLLTLPSPTYAAVLGKFLAAWAFAGVALALTFPMWITVNVLGEPDNGAILAGYFGSFLLAGGYLAIGACMSSVTSNQVIAFVLSAVISFAFTAAGSPVISATLINWAPPALADLLTSFSFLTQFDAMQRGAFEFDALFYFASLIAFWLFVNFLVVNSRKGDSL